MKRKMIVALTALAFASSMNAKTLVVSQTINGKEEIIAQKDITNDETGALRYNLCDNVRGISVEDYKSCESRVQYMNLVGGTTAIEFHHHEFVSFKQLDNRQFAIISEEKVSGAFLQDGKSGIIDKTPEKTLMVYLK